MYFPREVDSENHFESIFASIYRGYAIEHNSIRKYNGHLFYILCKTRFVAKISK